MRLPPDMNDQEARCKSCGCQKWEHVYPGNIQPCLCGSCTAFVPYEEPIDQSAARDQALAVLVARLFWIVQAQREARSPFVEKVPMDAVIEELKALLVSPSTSHEDMV